MHELTILNSGSVNAPVNAGNEAYIAGSASGNIDSTDILIYRYRLIGTVTLTGASSIAYSGAGSPAKNEEYEFNYESSVTPSGNTFSIFGVAVPDELLSSKFIAKCVYDGAAWVVNILPDFAGTGIIAGKLLAADSISTTKIIDDAVTNAKLANISRGSVKVGGASDAPTDLDAKTSGNILVGDGTDIASVAVSGDATLSSAGALTISNSAVTTAKIDDGAVTPTKLSASARKSMVAIPVSFETAGEIGVVKYTMCFDCTVDGIEATVTKPAATDTATIIFKDHGGSVLTGSQVDITTGLVLGNIVSTTPTANNTFSAGEQITFETSKPNPGSGNCTVVLCLTHD